ncbi:MAG: hypothetical protein JXA07_12725 [Spirochaetes bacterium]|nr:hypothetical protein [Spirochaetota bacterium]
MKKTNSKRNSCPMRGTSRRRIFADDPETRRRKRQEKAVIAAAIKRAARHFSPDQEDWL